MMSLDAVNISRTAADKVNYAAKVSVRSMKNYIYSIKFCFMNQLHIHVLIHRPTGSGFLVLSV